jgi:hypothetical protein
MSVEWAVEWALLSEVAGRPLSRQWPAIRAGDPAAADYLGPGIAVLYLDLESDAATLEWMTIDGDGFGDLLVSFSRGGEGGCRGVGRQSRPVA